VAVGGGIVVGVAVHDLVVAPLLGTPAFTPMLFRTLWDLGAAAVAACTTAVQPTIKTWQDLERVSVEIWRRPQPKPRPIPGENLRYAPRMPTPEPTPQHIFYFADVGRYDWPGRDTNQLVSYLSDYQNVINGVWGVRTQLERAQEQYDCKKGYLSGQRSDGAQI
jgi:hypothetical protein